MSSTNSDPSSSSSSSSSSSNTFNVGALTLGLFLEVQIVQTHVLGEKEKEKENENENENERCWAVVPYCESTANDSVDGLKHRHRDWTCEDVSKILELGNSEYLKTREVIKYEVETDSKITYRTITVGSSSETMKKCPAQRMIPLFGQIQHIDDQSLPYQENNGTHKKRNDPPPFKGTTFSSLLIEISNLVSMAGLEGLKSHLVGKDTVGSEIEKEHFPKNNTFLYCMMSLHHHYAERLAAPLLCYNNNYGRLLGLVLRMCGCVLRAVPGSEQSALVTGSDNDVATDNMINGNSHFRCKLYHESVDMKSIALSLTTQSESPMWTTTDSLQR